MSMQTPPLPDVIDKSKPIPLYYQIADDIKRRIADDELKPGDKLPTEQWLIEAYGVSRITVRRALSELIADGTVERTRGYGPVVAQPKLNRQVLRLTGLHEELAKAGLAPTSKIHGVARKPAQGTVARQLGLEEGETVLSFHRLRLADGQPIATQVIYMPDALCPGLDPNRLERDSLYRIIEQEYGLVIDYANQTVGVKVPGRRLAEELQLTECVGLLQMSRTTYLKTRQAIEYTQIYYVPGRYEISMSLYR